MFNSIFYSFLLIVQLFISDDSKTYNSKIDLIKKSIKTENYTKANLIAKDLISQSFFYNYELENLVFLLNLKSSKEDNKSLKVNRKIFKTIQLFENGKKKEALNFLKEELARNPSDSIIKWYEILNFSNQQVTIRKKTTVNQSNNKKGFDEKEALELLDLMKNKEKYIKYELPN